MIIKNATILLILVIFGSIPPVWADADKSMNDAANQERIAKMDENKGVIQKKGRSAKEPDKSLIKPKVKFQSDIPYSDYGAMIGSTDPGIDFLGTLKEKRKTKLTDSMDKLIYSFEFFQYAWKDKFLSFLEITKFNSSISDFTQSNLKPNPDVDKYFEEERTPVAFRLLQPKREEIFKEISMGFRFSFNPLSGHLFLEMNATPSSEKRSGLVIPF
jgi:hypothetical protein